jgi:mannose-1-phosphate guanylyltransferase
MIEQTCRRAALEIPAARTAVIFTEAHERDYAPLVAGRPRHCVVVQPENRGTAAAILYGTLRIAAIAPLGAVAVLPSDHYVSDDSVFMEHVAAAFAVVEARPELVVLLGITPEGAETEYGWIEPGARITARGSLRRAARFWEKPAPRLAQVLLERGCLWNSFVVVAGIPALLVMIRGTLPKLARAFDPVQPLVGTAAESPAVRALYRNLAPLSFSTDVLARGPANLAVLPVEGTQWSDWGQPNRVMETLDRLCVEPAWTERVASGTKATTSRKPRLCSRRDCISTRRSSSSSRPDVQHEDRARGRGGVQDGVTWRSRRARRKSHGAHEVEGEEAGHENHDLGHQG